MIKIRNKKITKNDVIDVLNSQEFQKYGSIGVSYDQMSTKITMDEAIKSFNTIIGETVFIQQLYKLDKDAEYMIQYVVHSESGPILIKGDVFFDDELLKVKNEGSAKNIVCHIKMTPIIKREAKKLGLVSENTVNGVMVRVKGPGSMYRQIELSMLNKEKRFSAPANMLTLKTARVYCSMLKTTYHHKFSASPAGPNTSIYFGYETHKTVFEDKMIDLVYSESKGKDFEAMAGHVSAIVDIMYPSEKLVHDEPEELMQSVYASEEDWNSVIISDHAAVDAGEVFNSNILDDDAIQIPRTPTFILTEDDEDEDTAADHWKTAPDVMMKSKNMLYNNPIHEEDQDF